MLEVAAPGCATGVACWAGAAAGALPVNAPNSPAAGPALATSATPAFLDVTAPKRPPCPLGGDGKLRVLHHALDLCHFGRIVCSSTQFGPVAASHQLLHLWPIKGSLINSRIGVPDPCWNRGSSQAGASELHDSVHLPGFSVNLAAAQVVVSQLDAGDA